MIKLLLPLKSAMSEEQTLGYFLRYVIPHTQPGLVCVGGFAEQ
jgi:hypothetical protein